MPDDDCIKKKLLFLQVLLYKRVICSMLLHGSKGAYHLMHQKHCPVISPVPKRATWAVSEFGGTCNSLLRCLLQENPSMHHTYLVSTLVYGWLYILCTCPAARRSRGSDEKKPYRLAIPAFFVSCQVLQVEGQELHNSSSIDWRADGFLLMEIKKTRRSSQGTLSPGTQATFCILVVVVVYTEFLNT